jgi:hypothetical protein
MLVTHTDKHRWIKKIDPEIFPDFGKNNTKKIKSLLEKLPTTTITHTITLLTPEDIIWFEAHYNTNISAKHNPKPYDVYATTLGKEVINFPYYILSLFENGEPIGGTIFTLRPDRLSMVYRTYPSDWNNAQEKCTPALYAEYLATAYALEQNRPYLVHGRDLNPYGVNSHVGVAIFKMSIGCYPDIKTTVTKTESDLNMLPYGSLLLIHPTEGIRITKGYLIGDAETAQRYEQLFKYPHLLDVTLYTPNI